MDFTLAFDTSWGKQGHEVATAQFLVMSADPGRAVAFQSMPVLQCREEAASLVIQGPGIASSLQYSLRRNLILDV